MKPERYCRCGHPESAHHPEKGCSARVGVYCRCSRFQETRSIMHPSERERKEALAPRYS